MKPLNDAERGKAKMKFILLFACAAFLIVIICSAFWGPLPTQPSQNSEAITPKKNSLVESKIWKISNTLHNQFTELQQFADVNKQVLQGNLEDETTVNIFKESQNAFKHTIDSIESSVASVNDEEYKKTVLSTTGLFRKELNYFSSFVANDEKLHKINKNVSTNDAGKQQLEVIKQDNQAKDATIINLQKQLNLQMRDITLAKQNLQEKDITISNLQKQVTAITQQNTESLSSTQKNIQLKDAKINELQKQLAATQSKSVPGNVNQQLTALQKDIQTKDAKINELQKQLVANKTNTVTNTSQPNVNALQKDLQTKDAKIASLQKQLDVYTKSSGSDIPSSNLSLTEENKFLKWALRSQVAISDNLTKQINQLKKK